MHISAKLLFIATVLAAVTLYFQNYFFPTFINKKILEGKGLKKDSEGRKAWENIPFPFDFKIYVFNVTNPAEAAKGAKIKLQEVGPFFYQEWKAKDIVEDLPSEDAVTFYMKNTYIFDQEKSKYLTGDEVINIPHVMIASLVAGVFKMKPTALGVLNKAIGPLFGNPGEIFVRTTVRAFLFDGMLINCSDTAFPVVAFCTEFRKNPTGLIQLDENHFLFSIFGAKNGTADTKLFKVNRGIRDPTMVGEVMEYDQSREQKVWPGKKCNEVHGTDSTVIPAFLDKDGFQVFAADFCRTIGTVFVGNVVYKGIPAYQYSSDFGDPRESEDKCYCSARDACLKRNTIDLSLCSGAPLVVSMPHFYESDPEYVDAVEGLQPRKEKHEIMFLVEPMSGSALMAYQRLQFNIMLTRQPKIKLMKELSETPVLVPLFWLEEAIILPDSYIELVQGLLGAFTKITIVSGVLISVCIGLCLTALYCKFGRAKLESKKNAVSVEKTVTP